MAEQVDILSLPDHVLIDIFNSLDPYDIAAVAAACRRFRACASEDAAVWGPPCEAAIGPSAHPPSAWGFPTYSQLYARFLRLVSPALGAWSGRLPPLGSLLLVHPEPPHIVGAIVASMHLGEPTASAVPVFRISYDAARGRVVAACTRGANTFGAMASRAFGAGGGPAQEPPSWAPHLARLKLSYGVRREGASAVAGGEVAGEAAAGAAVSWSSGAAGSPAGSPTAAARAAAAATAGAGWEELVDIGGKGAGQLAAAC